MGGQPSRQHRLSDARLLAEASEGDDLAFEELYRRHADAAWRAANAIASNADDAADAVAEAFTRVLRVVRRGETEITHFRSYLLTATRNVAVDRHRSREVAWEVDDELLSGDLAANPTRSPADSVIDLTDESYARRAFRDLPERWRRVLWLTEVEGLRPVDVAERLGMNANSVAQLAFRARAGLRERYLRAHVGDVTEADCRWTTERLNAKARGELPSSEHADVDSHLASCDGCREREADLTALALLRERPG